jgi:zinc transport system substrate-binding protein
MRYMLKLAAAVLFSVPVCAGPATAADTLPVFVSIVPQKYFVQQIGKDRVDVRVMVQPGASPATYEPSPAQMAALSGTRIYFAIGVAYEQVWLERLTAANPTMQVVHTDHGIDKLAMADDHHETSGHHGSAHDAGHHHPAGLDPHIWLSPPLVKVQARTIMQALQQADPAHGSVYEANFNDFASRIDELDAALKNTFAGTSGLQFMVFHPSWGYFARAYGLEQVPIEIEGKAPKPSRLKALIKRAKANGIRVIFVQPQFSTKSANLVAREIGGQVAFADPLAEDWMANLREVADLFKAALK